MSISGVDVSTCATALVAVMATVFGASGFTAGCVAATEGLARPAVVETGRTGVGVGAAAYVLREEDEDHAV